MAALVIDGNDSSSSTPAASRAIAVLVADDQQLFRDAVCRIVELASGFVVVGEARTGEEAIEMAAARRVDLVVMDMRMPGIGGVEAARRINEMGTAAAVVLISADPDAAMADTIARSGAVALIGKDRLRPSTLVEVWADLRREP